MAAVACGGKTATGGKDKIVIGQVRTQSGPNASSVDNGFAPVRDLWIEQVSADGGIKVGADGKKLPVEMLIYDDGGNLDTMKQLYEKLMTVDKVDFVFAPNSTEFTAAAAALANDHGYMMMSAEGGNTSTEALLPDLPMFFLMRTYSSWYQNPRLLQIMGQAAVKTIAIAYPDDAGGVEYLDSIHEELVVFGGVDNVYEQSFPADASDFSTIIQQVRALDPDCFYFPGQPEQNLALTRQLIQAGYNPKMLVMGRGAATSAYAYAMGSGASPDYAAINGVISYGAWSIHSSPELAKLHDDLLNSPTLKAQGFTEADMDYWGAALYMAELQMFQQAIEKAGTLDNVKVAELIGSGDHFQTVLGESWTDRQKLTQDAHPGEIGQWQNGVFEIIDRGPKRTADPIYPKPAWPAP
jgi:branched-chain amino acid transport system substrate-binding protein